MHQNLLILLVIILTTSSSMAADAPETSPSSNITATMSRKHCKTFADLLISTPDADSTIESNVESGLTLFCPSDSALSKFIAKFDNFSDDDKLSLILFHGIPVYYSMSMLQSNNGVMNTLATDGLTKNFNLTVQNDGQDVTLRTQTSSATIVDTVIDMNPVSVFEISDVLRPVELFKPAPAPIQAPAPEGGASDESPDRRKGVLAPNGEAPAKSPAADEKDGEKNSGDRSCGELVAMIMMIMTMISVVINYA